MKEDAIDLLAKHGITYSALTPLAGGVNATWRLEGTEFVLRVAPPNISGDAVLASLRAAAALQQAGVHFVVPAFPVTLSALTRRGEWVNGALWFYEEPTGEAIDYEDLGGVIRSLQEVGGDSTLASGLGLPEALDAGALQSELDAVKEWGLIADEDYDVMNAWIPRLRRGLQRLPEGKRVLVHDDLWPKNMLMTRARGLVLCDPDNLGWGRPEYDPAFITRARERNLITKNDVQAFEQGYGARIPDINTAWKLALFHRFRWVCHMLERLDWDSEAQERLAGELKLWRRRRGPQPG